MSILILGVGNILLRDEGIGVHAVNALEARYRIPPEVEVMDGGTAGMELTAALASRDDLILVDAVNTGAASGTRIRLENEEVPALFKSRISPHQLGISDLLGVLRVTGEMPRRMTLLGVVPHDMETGTELSAAMAPRLDELVEALVAELAERGIELQPRSAEAG